MSQGGILLSYRKYLAWLAFALLAFAVLLSPRALAADSGGGRACSTSMPPTPYTNGAPVVRAFYPADGSTVTVTSTGAVIKQSPCQTPYREGWINPDNICHLNTFDQLGGMMSKSDSNPNPNTDPVYTCSANPPAPSPTPVPAPAPAPPTSTTIITNKTHHDHGVVKSETTTNPSPPPTPAPAPPTTTLPDTGPGDVLAVGGISTVLGTVGHFFYRRHGITS